MKSSEVILIEAECLKTKLEYAKYIGLCLGVMRAMTHYDLPKETKEGLEYIIKEVEEFVNNQNAPKDR